LPPWRPAKRPPPSPPRWSRRRASEPPPPTDPHGSARRLFFCYFLIFLLYSLLSVLGHRGKTDANLEGEDDEKNFGDIIEDGSLLEFATKDKQKWHNSLPVNFYYRFQNSGADRVFPKSSLTINNIIGQDTAVIDANPTEGNVLPGSIRRFEVWWKSKNDTSIIPKLQPSDLSFIDSIKYQWNNFAFGRYTADLRINYGNKGEVATGSFAFFVFPWQLLLIEVLILGIGFFLIRFIFKRYNRWIIKKARS
jgi:hypothetical protein